MIGMYGFSELTCTEIYPKYLEFRNSVFNKTLKYNESGNAVYDLQTYNADDPATAMDVEYDHYDTPKTLHLALVRITSAQWHKPFMSTNLSAADIKNISVLGCLRFLPTDGPYMIKDNIAQGAWRNVDHLLKILPSQSDVYEASRIAVSPFLGRNDPLREIVLDNLVYANVEIAVRLGIKKMVGIMYDRVWESVYRKRGVPVSYVSDPFYIDTGQPIIVGEIDVSESVLNQLKERYAYEISQSVIKQPYIDPGTWMTHYSRINKMVPAFIPMHSVPSEANYSVAG